ncbi:MAG: FliG C-terminal domain-containing protein, partial [Pseudomonadota bacterium]
AAEYVLGNISSRMADAMREEIADLDKVPKKEGEAAMTDIVNGIRRLEAAGEIVLMSPGGARDEDDDDDDMAGTGGTGD